MYVAAMAMTFGFLLPFYYLPLYAREVADLSPQDGAILVAIVNACSAIGRVVLGFVADHVGRMNSLCLCVFGGALSVLLWPLCTTYPTLVVFAACYGFFGGGFVSLMPVILADFWGTERLAGTIGLFLTSNVLGYFFGVTLGAKIYEESGNSFTFAALYSGGMMMVAFFGYLVVKFIRQPPLWCSLCKKK